MLYSGGVVSGLVVVTFNGDESERLVEMRERLERFERERDWRDLRERDWRDLSERLTGREFPGKLVAEVGPT